MKRGKIYLELWIVIILAYMFLFSACLSERKKEEPIIYPVKPLEGETIYAEKYQTKTPEITEEIESSEIGDSGTEYEDRGTDTGSEITGAGEGYEDDSAISVSSIPISESADNLWDGERADDTSECDSNSGFESEQSEYSYDRAVDEQGFAEDAGEYDYDSEYGEEPVSEPEVPGDDSNEQYGDTEYSEDTNAGYSNETDNSLTYLGTWTISFYCPCEICCGNYASGYTASGTLATEGVTVACGSLPIGTQVYIEGFGYRIVEDTGVYGDWIDIFVYDHQTALDLGLQNREVYIVE